MEGIMEDFDEGDPSLSEDIDSDYEFDAPHFYDFSRDDEAEDDENWFRPANEYPPSPLIVKLRLMKAAKSVAQKTKCRKKEANRKISTSSNSDCENDHKFATREVKIKGVKHHSHIPHGSMKGRSKSIVNLSKQSGSSFMKPTASHLAKQNKDGIIRSRSCGRLHN
ncbi:hypothetical protein R6Q59_019847 [Mikania micrantha]